MSPVEIGRVWWDEVLEVGQQMMTECGSQTRSLLQLASSVS